MNLPNGALLQGGRYRIERVLGQGGFGITYLAEQVGLGRKVAIKEFFMKDFNVRDDNTGMVTLPSSGSTKQVEQYRIKFVKEARNLVALKHPHIIQVIDIFDENGTVYYVMPFYSGGSLSDRVKANGPLDEQSAMRMIRPIAAALLYMHSQKRLCHYDVKPANILLDDKGSPVLIDFGIAKNYDTGGNETSSTPIGMSEGYAPIEQYEAQVQEFSPESDVYALGATLYYLLTGKKPITAIARVGGAMLDLPDNCSPNVRQLIETSMTIARQKRPKTTAIFLQDESLPAQAPDEPTKPEAGEVTKASAPLAAHSDTHADEAPSAPKPKKKPWLWPVVALALCLLGVGGYYGYKAYQKSKIDYTTYNPDLVAAAEAGDADAQAALGDCYYRGYGVTIDRKKAFEWYQKAAEQNNPLGLYGLGVCYQTGLGVEADSIIGEEYLNQAGKMLVKMEDSDDPRLITALGICYDYGNGVEKNEMKAVELYRKAAEQGHARGQHNLGYCYDEGMGVAKDKEEAVKWYRKAAEQGYADAQTNLGYCYYNGEGVAKDKEEAVKWYRKAAEQGYADAQTNLGNCYHNGEGVAKDQEEAVKWYRKAAEQGHAGAQCSLGYCYDEGTGVSKDYDEAVKWYRIAAEQGLPVAQYNLGVSYEYGEGVAKDYDEAVKWYRKAAEQGHADAQNNLGYCYDEGHGVPKDLNEAIKWYQKAARQGNEIAQQNLRNLGRSW